MSVTLRPHRKVVQQVEGHIELPKFWCSPDLVWERGQLVVGHIQELQGWQGENSIWQVVQSIVLREQMRSMRVCMQ